MINRVRERYIAAFAFALGLVWAPIGDSVRDSIRQIYGANPVTIVGLTAVGIVYAIVSLLVIYGLLQLVRCCYFKWESIRRILHGSSYIEGVWVDRVRDSAGVVQELAIILIQYGKDEEVIVEGDSFFPDRAELHFSSTGSVYNENTRTLRFSYQVTPIDGSRNRDPGLAFYRFIHSSGKAVGFDGQFSDAGRSVVKATGEIIADKALATTLERSHEKRRNYALTMIHSASGSVVP